MDARFSITEVGFGGKVRGRPKVVWSDIPTQARVIPEGGKTTLTVVGRHMNDDAEVVLRMTKDEVQELIAKLQKAVNQS
jgi:hypothetical protein